MNKAGGDSQKKGKTMEGIIYKFFNNLKDKLSEELHNTNSNFLEIKNIEEVFTQDGGNQKGKDRILIFNISTPNGVIRMPVFVESKADEANTRTPKELDLNAKINQIECSLEARKYINSPEYTGASFLLFMPFSCLNSNDFNEIISVKTAYDNLNFPDHFWDISNNPTRSRKLLSTDEVVSKELLESGYFKKSASLIRFAQDDELEEEIVQKIANNMLMAYEKHIKNFHRVRNLLNDITNDEKANVSLVDQAKIKTNNSIISIINFTEDKEKIVKKYTANIESIDNYRFNYLIRQLNIQLNGGYFGKLIPNIEKYLEEIFIDYVDFFTDYKDFKDLNTNILDIISASINGFSKFDDNSQIIDSFLLSDPAKKLGSFYQRCIEGLANLKLSESKVEIYANNK